MKPSAYLILYTARKKRNNKYPVKVRVVYQRSYHDFKTGIDMTEEEFAQANFPKPKKDFREAASKLNEVKSKVDQVIQGLKIFTFQKFEDAFYDSPNKDYSVFGLFEEYIAALRNEERIKTAMSYQTAANAIRSFNPKLTIYDVDVKFLKDFHIALLNGGKSLTTIGIYLRSLRAIYNFAITKGIIKRDEDYPFVRGKYIIPSSTNVKKALESDEILRIINFPCSNRSFADRAKDFWLFSYLCNGINFKDIALLKWKNIDGSMIRFVREKTKRTTQGNQRLVSCYISDEVRCIIEKWKNDSGDPEDYVFSIINKIDNAEERQKKIDQFVQNTNKNLKRICKAVGIEKSVSTYYSRHSAATTLKRSGASILQIQEALGHSSSIVTQKYLDSFHDESKMELGLTLLKSIKNAS